MDAAGTGMRRGRAVPGRPGAGFPGWLIEYREGKR